MKYVKGDILTVKSGLIIHGANAQGVMGSGVAKVLRDKYPEIFKVYKEDLDYGMGLGNVSWCHLYVGQEEQRNLHIASAITQEYYGGDGKKYVSYDAIDDAFNEIFGCAKEWDTTVCLPLIGCGLGGGNWSVVEAIILSAADKNNYSKEMITVYKL